MNQESPFESYLAGRASDLDVPGAGVAGIADRARSRRRRRRTGSAAVLGVAVLIGGAVVGQGMRSDDDAQELTSYGAGITDSELDWATAPVSNGLGWTRGLVQSGSGDLYSLSTAAGPGDSQESYRPTLYGSSDGSEWSEAPMPDGLSLSGISAAGDTIYAVGTGSAGGSVRLASTGSPDQGWAVTDLPLDLVGEAQAADLPGRLVVSDVKVAAAGGTTVVAASVVLQVDVASVLPADADPQEWYPTVDGVERWVCAADDGTAILAPSTVPDAELTDDERAKLAERAGTSAPEGAEPDPAARPANEPGVEGRGDDACTPEVRTWAELGQDPAIGDLTNGEVRVFVSHTDEAGAAGDFAEVPAAAAVSGWQFELLADGTGGFWLLGQGVDADSEKAAALFSPDGSDWSAPPVVVDGAAVASGLVDGQVNVVTLDWESSSVTLHRLTAGGGVEAVDLTDIVNLGDERYFQAAGVGPLGVVVVTSADGGSEVVHSLDGVSFSRTAVPADGDGNRQAVNGVTMSADAVKIRLNIYPPGDTAGGPPAGQRLFVGTPR